ncbi:MAG: site-2 protease family protein [Nitrospirae bacterium]|nr:site-2 protease family protein [Nitrospirota bacterium]
MDTAQLQRLIVSLPALLIAITFHEVSHGFVANKLGDPTAKFMGRLTLNPLVHIDPFGTIILPLVMLYMTDGRFVFGYAKPVPINPMNFKDPRKGMALSAAAGPVTNILLAIASTLVLKLVILPLTSILPAAVNETVMKPLAMVAVSSVLINVVLASFNMIPVPPLDGGRVLTGLLPHRQAMTFSKIEPFGFIIVLALIYTGIANYIITPVITFFMTLLQVF